MHRFRRIARLVVGLIGVLVTGFALWVMLAFPNDAEGHLTTLGSAIMIGGLIAGPVLVLFAFRRHR